MSSDPKATTKTTTITTNVSITISVATPRGMRRAIRSTTGAMAIAANPGPLIAIGGWVPFESETVRWIAIGVGLIGVIVAMRPTGEGWMSLGSLAAIGSALGYSLSAITVRTLGKTDSTQSMVLWMTVMVGLGAGALAWPDWKPIASEHWPAIAVVGVAGAIAQYAVTIAFKLGEASAIAPFEYTALAWGVLLDWLLWQTLPDRYVFVGAGIIVASGIYLIRHERVHAEAEHP